MSDENKNRQQDDKSLALLDEQAEEQIRRVWHDGRWFFSVIDVIGLLTESSTPRRYWTDMKHRLQDEGFIEVYANCVQLKLPSNDGKQRLTDAADAETLLRLIQSVPSPKAEPFKRWLARVGAERLREIEHPELAADRMRSLYRAQGYSDEWIDRRLQGIVIRDELTEEWRERGAHEGREFAILTDILQRGAFDLSIAEHKTIKRLKSRDNLRDSVTTMELLLTALAEETVKTMHQARDSQGMPKLQRDAHEAGDVAGATRRDIESRTGQPVVSSDNYRTLTARAAQPELFGERDEQ